MNGPCPHIHLVLQHVAKVRISYSCKKCNERFSAKLVPYADAAPVSKVVYPPTQMLRKFGLEDEKCS